LEIAKECPLADLELPLKLIIAEVSR